MAFSKLDSLSRAFSASLDKTFRIYDLNAKCTIKTIQTLSPITNMAVDTVESFVYLSCENLNVYQYPLGFQANTSIGILGQ